jgi:hypothetical protein
MKRLLFATGLFTAVASTYVFGQFPAYSQKAVAQIPFDFQTGDVHMPAGKYTINQKGDLLTVQGEAGKPSAILFTSPAPDQRQPTAAPALTFTRYNNTDYFLSRVWSSDSREGRALPKGKREKELVRRMTFTKSDAVALEMNTSRPNAVR